MQAISLYPNALPEIRPIESRIARFNGLSKAYCPS